jgi:hypothetical protein
LRNAGKNLLSMCFFIIPSFQYSIIPLIPTFQFLRQGS